ncbi:hypothetical protein ACO22_02267 [Paracoccidioides brasiliensis]|uniref:Uncharacterized protein n=1 Tax=Paracoccidioides brasiliensis TaxID=121759 RepID=A0A1D2JJ87_PARBR|nr:hypothetical protein ACO22_02267 [Paracoccidioides brasiliensis]
MVFIEAGSNPSLQPSCYVIFGISVIVNSFIEAELGVDNVRIFGTVILQIQHGGPLPPTSFESDANEVPTCPRQQPLYARLSRSCEAQRSRFRPSSAEELCTSVEVYVSTICASVPIMRSIIKVHMGGSSADRGPSHELDENSDSNRGQALTLNNGWSKTTARPQQPAEGGEELEEALSKSKSHRSSSLSNDSEVVIITPEEYRQRQQQDQRQYKQA